MLSPQEQAIDEILSYQTFRREARKAGLSLYANMYGYQEKWKEPGDLCDYRVQGLVYVSQRPFWHPLQIVGLPLKREPVAELKSAPWMSSDWEFEQISKKMPTSKENLALNIVHPEWIETLKDVAEAYTDKTGLLCQLRYYGHKLEDIKP